MGAFDQDRYLTRVPEFAAKTVPYTFLFGKRNTVRGTLLRVRGAVALRGSLPRDAGSNPAPAN